MAFDHIHFLGLTLLINQHHFFVKIAQANLLVIHFPARCQHLLSFLVKLHGVLLKGIVNVVNDHRLCFVALFWGHV